MVYDNRMSRRGLLRGFGVAQLAIGMLFVIIGLRAALMPAQVDTYWHLRAGADIWRTGQVPRVESYSFTAAGWPWRDHEWLWQPISYAFYHLGGMPLLTLFGAALVLATVALSYRLMIGAAWVRFFLMIAWLPLLPSAWTLRPQLLSLLAVPLLQTLLVRGRHALIPLLFVVWANVHGAVALGGVLLGAATATALLRWRVYGAPEDRRRARALAVVLPLSGLACLVTPLGTGIFHFLSDSMRRIRAVHIEEWRSAFAIEQLAISFWIVAAAFVFLLIKRRRALRDGPASSWAAWVTVACACALLPLAFAALRNVGPFVLLGVPAASHLIGAGLGTGPAAREAPASPSTPAPPGHPIINVIVLAGMVVAAAGLLFRSYRAPAPELDWHPITDGAIAAVRACPGPLYNQYDEGGYLLWFVPERPIFVDGRQDPFPLSHILAQLDVQWGRAPYRPLFDRWGIRCAFLPVGSGTTAALERDGWITRYRDDRYAVLSAPPAAR